MKLGSGIEGTPDKVRGRSDLLKKILKALVIFVEVVRMWSLWNPLDPYLRRARTDTEIPSLPVSFKVME